MVCPQQVVAGEVLRSHAECHRGTARGGARRVSQLLRGTFQSGDLRFFFLFRLKYYNVVPPSYKLVYNPINYRYIYCTISPGYWRCSIY